MRLVIGVIIGALIGAAPVSAGVDISCLYPQQKRQAREILTAHSFDFDRISDDVRVRVTNTSDYNAIGLTWPFGLVQIDDDYLDRFPEIFTHELGHVVDFAYLTPTMRSKVSGWVGLPWKVMKEDWPALFTSTFTSERLDAENFTITDEMVAKTRRLFR